MSNKKNIKVTNLNARNFNYHTLSRDGIRGGMEWVAMEQQEWDLNPQLFPNQILGTGTLKKGGISYDPMSTPEDNIGLLFTAAPKTCFDPQRDCSKANFLIFVDNANKVHVLAGDGKVGYWTPKAMVGADTTQRMPGYIMNDLGVDQSGVLITSNIENYYSHLSQETYLSGWSPGGMGYTDSCGNNVPLVAPLVVMDHLQLREASGTHLSYYDTNSSPNPALGTIRYSYGPSGSQFEGLVNRPSGTGGAAVWVPFGAGDTTVIENWRPESLPGTGKQKITTAAPMGAVLPSQTLELDGADASGIYSVAIGFGSKTLVDASHSIAVGWLCTAAAPYVVAMGGDHVVDASGGTALGRGHRVGAGVIDSGGGTAGAGQAWYATAIGSCHSIAQGTDASGRNAVALGGSHEIAYASSSCAPYAVALGRRCKIASGYGGSSAYAAFTEGSGNRIADGSGSNADFAVAMGQNNFIGTGMGSTASYSMAFMGGSVTAGGHTSSNHIADGSGSWAPHAFAMGVHVTIAKGTRSRAEHAICIGRNSYIAQGTDSSGHYAFQVGRGNNIARGTGSIGDHAFAEGSGNIMARGTSSSALLSVAMGEGNIIADGSGSAAPFAVALGLQNQIGSGTGAHANLSMAMGNLNTIGGGIDASGYNSFAMGHKNKIADGSYSDVTFSAALGDQNSIGAGTSSHAYCSFAMGTNNKIADGSGSSAWNVFAEGSGNVIARGPQSNASCSIAMGGTNHIADGSNSVADFAVAMGQNNHIADGSGSKAAFAIALMGGIITASSINSNHIADGSGSVAHSAFAMGAGHVIARGIRSTAENAVAMGANNNIAAGTDSSANYAIAIGSSNNIAHGTNSYANYAFAAGSGNHIAHGPNASANFAIAMGSSNVVDASFGVAIGESNYATRHHAIAMGWDCSATGIASFANGSGCVAGGNYSVAMGEGNTVYQFTIPGGGYPSSCAAAAAVGIQNIIGGGGGAGTGAIAMGSANTIAYQEEWHALEQTAATGAVAMGNKNIIAIKSSTVSLGEAVRTYAHAAVAMGESNICCSGNFVTANYSVAMGTGNIIADGSGISATASFAMGECNTIAQGNNVTADYAIAMGSSNVVDASFGVAIGESNTVSAHHGMAFGVCNDVSGTRGFAGGGYNTIGVSGDYSAVFGENNVALGANCFVAGEYNTAGSGVGANGHGFATALGSSCSATGYYSFAAGSHCDASGANSIAMGSDCSATVPHSIALGSGAVTLPKDASHNSFQFVVGIPSLASSAGRSGNTFFIDNSENVGMCVGGDPSFDISQCRPLTGHATVDISGDLNVRGVIDPLGLGLVNMTPKQATEIYNSMGVKGRSSQLLFSNSDSRHPLWHVYWDDAAEKAVAAIIGGGGYSLGGYTGHVGEIMTYAGDPSNSTVNEHWIHCDGRALTTTQDGGKYAALFKAIGTKYGGYELQGGADHAFNLPDLRGRMLVGDASGADPSPTRSALAYSTTASIPHSCTLADCSSADASGVCGFNKIRAASLTMHTHGVAGAHASGGLTVSTPATCLLTSLAHTHTLDAGATGHVPSPNIMDALAFAAGSLTSNAPTGGTATHHHGLGGPGLGHTKQTTGGLITNIPPSTFTHHHDTGPQPMSATWKSNPNQPAPVSVRCMGRGSPGGVEFGEATIQPAGEVKAITGTLVPIALGGTTDPGGPTLTYSLNATTLSANTSTTTAPITWSNGAITATNNSTSTPAFAIASMTGNMDDISIDASGQSAAYLPPAVVVNFMMRYKTEREGLWMQVADLLVPSDICGNVEGIRLLNTEIRGGSGEDVPPPGGIGLRNGGLLTVKASGGPDCLAAGKYSVAIGKGARAGTEGYKTCEFMFKDSYGNEFCFDSGGAFGSGQIMVNGHLVQGGGGGGGGGGVGEIIAFAGPSGDKHHPGPDWLFCDGRDLSSSNYPDLFHVIGTRYGTGNGSATNFNIPDLRGRMLVGDASGTDPSPTRSALAYSSGHPPDASNADSSGVCGFNTIRAKSLTRHTHDLGDGANATVPSPQIVGALTTGPTDHSHPIAPWLPSSGPMPVAHSLTITAGGEPAPLDHQHGLGGSLSMNMFEHPTGGVGYGRLPGETSFTSSTSQFTPWDGDPGPAPQLDITGPISINLPGLAAIAANLSASSLSSSLPSPLLLPGSPATVSLDDLHIDASGHGAAYLPPAVVVNFFIRAFDPSGTGNWVQMANHLLKPESVDVSGIQLLKTIIRGGDASGAFTVGGVDISGYNTATGEYSVAMGYNCSAEGTASFADGSGCTAGGDYSVAIGSGSTASSDYSVVMGGGCQAEGSYAVAIGSGATALNGEICLRPEGASANYCFNSVGTISFGGTAITTAPASHGMRYYSSPPATGSYDIVTTQLGMTSTILSPEAMVKVTLISAGGRGGVGAVNSNDPEATFLGGGGGGGGGMLFFYTQAQQLYGQSVTFGSVNQAGITSNTVLECTQIWVGDDGSLQTSGTIAYHAIGGGHGGDADFDNAGASNDGGAGGGGGYCECWEMPHGQHLDPTDPTSTVCRAFGNFSMVSGGNSVSGAGGGIGGLRAQGAGGAGFFGYGGGGRGGGSANEQPAAPTPGQSGAIILEW